MRRDPALVADIGGTNARFALAENDGDGVRLSSMQVFRAEDFESICDAADAYLEAVAKKPNRACFAVAGPVTGDAIKFTNSSWVFRIGEIRSALGLQRILVVNDFEALACGVRRLTDEDLATIGSGAGDPTAPTLVIGPGTGFGQALIVPFDGCERVVPTEGGHVSFAPRTQKEIEIMQFIAREHPRVSVERLLSGRGLVNIHRALCALADTPRISLRADEITAAAKTKKFPIASEAVDMFCAILGDVAGDAALTTGARGGVVLGGGILPMIRDIFVRSRFVDCFLGKGRMRTYLESIPVKLIIRDGAALVGAAVMLRAASDEN